MDNLSYEEEEALRDMIVRLNGAWGMYFSVVRLRWPKLSALIDRAEEIREALQLEVQRLFFGEVVPALGARWLVAHDGLEKALELIGKETKCGLLVIHHTNKPPSDADKRNFGKGAFAQYIGAGGQEINAWMRGMLLLMPTIEPGIYELSAVKRGNRLGWTNPPGKNFLFPTKIIRQSPKEDHMLFWHEVGAVPESLQSRTAKQKRDPAVDAHEFSLVFPDISHWENRVGKPFSRFSHRLL